MKKPVVDYRTFRLRRLNEPQFAHLKLLLGWIGYFILCILVCSDRFLSGIFSAVQCGQL